MDSTGLETSGLLHHQATEGLSMSYREDMWVMSEYYMIKYPDAKKVVIFNEHAILRV